jgi:UDP-glucose 4-epimerase
MPVVPDGATTPDDEPGASDRGCVATGVVAVTGASGFIGRHLVRHLASKGWRVIALARKPDKSVWADGIVPRILPDLERAVDFAPLLDGATHVVHLAGLAHASPARSQSRYQAINADASAALARAARAVGIRRLVLVSSVRAQSGPVAKSIVRESDEPNPTDDYGRSKLAAERLVAAALEGSATEWVALRPVLVFGSDVKGNMGALMRLARLPLPLPFAALSNRRSLLGVDNLASAVAHALTEPRCARATFLVADAEALAIPDIIAALRQGLGRDAGLFAPPRGGFTLLARVMGKLEAWRRLSGDLVADASALRRTGWSPVVDTREALAIAARRDGASRQRHRP